MRRIVIQAPYWDGERLHKRGAVVDFPAEGDLPPGASLVAEEGEPELDPLAKVKKP